MKKIVRIGKKFRKSYIALKLIKEYGVSITEVAIWSDISTSGIAQIIRRNKFF